jgi:hypothetical protein
LRIKAKDEAQAATAAAQVEQARKSELENEKLIQERQSEIPGLRSRLGLERAVGAAESAYGGAAAATEQTRISEKRVSQAAGGADLAEFLQSLTDLTVNAATLAGLKNSIKSANAAVIEAFKVIEDSNKRLENEAKRNSTTRTLPGSG